MSLKVTIIIKQVKQSVGNVIESRLDQNSYIENSINFMIRD